MAQTATNTLSAREKLYGPGRLLNTARSAQRMQKSSLIQKGESYDNDGDLESVTALSFRVRFEIGNSKSNSLSFLASTIEL